MAHRAEACPAASLRPEPLVTAWFAIRTRSRAEEAVANRLAALDLDTFLPRYRELVEWSDRKHVTQRCLFPGYLFVKFDRGDERVARTAGVAQVLAESIPDAQIETIRIACDANQQLTPAPYRTGETVRVRSGPFAGCEAVVDRLNKRRLILRIDVLQRAVSLEIDARTALERVR